MTIQSRSVEQTLLNKSTIKVYFLSWTITLRRNQKKNALYNNINLGVGAIGRRLHLSLLMF